MEKKNIIVLSRQLPDHEFQGALKKGSLNIFIRTESLEPVERTEYRCGKRIKSTERLVV